MRKSCWARSLAAAVFVGALFFGFAEAEAVHLEDGAIIDYDITGLGDVEVGRDIPEIVPATVDFMPASVSAGTTGAITQGNINVGKYGTVNMYGGVFNSVWGPSYEGWAEITIALGANVTFYGQDFIIDDVPIDEGVVEYPLDIYSIHNVAWADADGGSYNIWVSTDAPINLNWLGIYVDVPVDPDSGLLSYDFGDVDINGEPKTFVIPIYNYGSNVLTVTSVSIDGSGDFAITASPAEPFTILPRENPEDDYIGVDIEVTFAPQEEGMLYATVIIASDDVDEDEVKVYLAGNGTVDDVLPEDQIQAILDFYDVSAENPVLLEGDGPGKSAPKRLKALRNMIKAAGDLINLGEYELAAKQLRSVAKKTDGERRPPDFVVGYSVEALNAMVNDLIADLTL